MTNETKKKTRNTGAVVVQRYCHDTGDWTDGNDCFDTIEKASAWIKMNATEAVTYRVARVYNQCTVDIEVTEKRTLKWS